MKYVCRLLLSVSLFMPAYYFSNNMLPPDLSVSGSLGNKDSERTYYDKGLKKVTSGDFVEAVRWFSRAIENDSTLVAAYISRAQAKSKLLDFKSALDDYNR